MQNTFPHRIEYGFASIEYAFVSANKNCKCAVFRTFYAAGNWGVEVFEFLLSRVVAKARERAGSEELMSMTTALFASAATQPLVWPSPCEPRKTASTMSELGSIVIRTSSADAFSRSSLRASSAFVILLDRSASASAGIHVVLRLPCFAVSKAVACPVPMLRII